MPIDRAALADDAHAIFPVPGGPCEQDGRDPVGKCDEELSGIFDFVLAVAETACPRLDSLRLTAKIQKGVQQVRTVVEQDTAAALTLEGPPRHLSAIRFEAIHGELGQMPLADGSVSD